MAEKEFQAEFVSRLRRIGWKVHEQVYCRATRDWNSKSSTRDKLDIYTIPPPDFSDRYGLWHIGIEMKDCIELGSDVIQPVFQAADYLSSVNFCTQKSEGGKPLPRPDVILIARKHVVNTPIESMKRDDQVALAITERFAWKFGCAVLKRRNNKGIGFESNAGNMNSQWIQVHADMRTGLYTPPEHMESPF